MAPRSTLLLLSALSLLIALVLAKSPTKPTPPSARKEDIKYIKCGVCEEVVKQLSRQVKKQREHVAPKQLSEYQIIELAENICNLKRSEGDWMLHLDIVEVGDKLTLVEQIQEGECNTECKTIERACQEVIGYHDTDVAEFLFKDETQGAALSKFLCKDLNKACVGTTPSVPKDRAPGEPFIPKSSKDAEMERIMRSMGDMPGAPGMKMYSREDLMNGMPGLDDNDDDEDDDEDEEVPHRGKSIGGKATGVDKLLNQANSIVNTVKKGTQKALLNTQKHIQRALDWFGRWWSGKKPYSSSEASNSNAAEL